MRDSNTWCPPVAIPNQRSRLYVSENFATTHEFIAVEQITARMGSPSFKAVARDLIYKAPTPSARAYPSADSSNVRHRDVGDRTPSLAVFMCWSGVRIRLEPPTKAASQSWFLMAEQAMWRAASEEEQAVLITALVAVSYKGFGAGQPSHLGPRRSKTCASLLARIPGSTPVAV